MITRVRSSIYTTLQFNTSHRISMYTDGWLTLYIPAGALAPTAAG